MTQDTAPISASRGSVPLSGAPENTGKESDVPAVGRENVNPENPDEADPKPMPPDSAYSPGASFRVGGEATQTGGSALPRDAVAQETNDKDTDPNSDGPHGTPDNTWSTLASDSEADVDGSLDISRQNPQGVDGVRSSDS